MPQVKTNVMRILDAAKIPYQMHSYDVSDGRLDGLTAAARLGKPPECVYKTLVTAHDRENYVFVIPVAKELDLKLAAKAAGVKNLSMIPQAALLKTTGYIHGGCSPLGMKKRFLTWIDASAETLFSMVVSAGRVGTQIELSPQNLAKVSGAGFATLVRETEEEA